MDKIEKAFDEINKEARTAYVDCGIRSWLYYSTVVCKDGKDEFYDVLKSYPNTMPACIQIQDKNGLLMKISDYVDKAFCFYDELDYDRVENPLKYTIATALMNLSLDDFTNLESFFERREHFLQDESLKHFKIAREIGYSSIFDANIEVALRKEPIFMETPYGLYISIVRYNEEGRKLSYPLPVVRLGIDEDTVYFYAIQKDQSEEWNDDKEFVAFSKKIRRKMYGVDKGMAREEKDVLGIENIHEVSPWAMIALTITLGLLKKVGIQRMVAYPLLLNRYNANVVYSQEELKRLAGNKEAIYKDIKDHLAYLKENIDVIQENITDKFIRTFRRIGYHFPGIEIDDCMDLHPFALEMIVNHGDMCNNPILQEMFQLGLCYNCGNVKRKVI